jgi:holo-[acyl-carrier protein] synthase
MPASQLEIKNPPEITYGFRDFSFMNGVMLCESELISLISTGWKQRWRERRVFSAGELDYCLAKRNPYPSLAVRFAVKEAFRKIDLCFCQGIRFQDVEVAVREGGRPELVLHAQALARTKEIGIDRWEMSLAHSRNQAIAAIIAYGE